MFHFLVVFRSKVLLNLCDQWKFLLKSENRKVRRGGLVVQRQTSKQEVRGSILTQVTMLYPRARYTYLPKSTGNTQEVVALSRHD